MELPWLWETKTLSRPTGIQNRTICMKEFHHQIFSKSHNFPELSFFLFQIWPSEPGGFVPPLYSRFVFKEPFPLPFPNVTQWAWWAVTSFASWSAFTQIWIRQKPMCFFGPFCSHIEYIYIINIYRSWEEKLVVKEHKSDVYLFLGHKCISVFAVKILSSNFATITPIHYPFTIPSEYWIFWEIFWSATKI